MRVPWVIAAATRSGPVFSPGPFPVVCLLLALAVSGCAGVNAEHPGTPAEWRTEMQPALSNEDRETIASGLDLGAALRIGCERNPAVQAAGKRWLAAIHVEPQAVTPPDPMAGYGYQFKSVETRVGPQRWNTGLTQQLPWPQKLWARGRVAATQADIAQLRYEAAMRDLVVAIKDSCYELYYLDQALPITENVESMLRNDALLAYATLTVGQTQLREAFRAESQAAQLSYDRILLVEQRAAQAERLKSLMNLPPDTVIGPVKEAPVYDVSQSTDDLYARAERYAEVLKIKGLETQKAAYESFLAKLTWVPDVTLGFNFIQTDKAVPMTSGGSGGGGSATPATPTTVRDSGKDPFVGLFSMNLPIWWWRNEAVIREKSALEEAMRIDALDETNRVRASVARAHFQVELTDRLVRLYADTLLPQAQEIMRQSEALFRGGQASFSNTIETTLAYHNFTLAWLRAGADHGQAIGRLETVLGTTAEPRDTGEGTPTESRGAQP